MPMHLTVQREIESALTPSDEQFLAWVEESQLDPILSIEITLRIVDKVEIQSLNKLYLGKDKPTNVLSFVSEVPEGAAPTQVLADIIDDRWAHMVVHGCLHVQGFDHEQEDEREFMEAEECRILNGLGIRDPYQSDEQDG